jgi:DNA polymerase-3 subunit delta'
MLLVAKNVSLSYNRIMDWGIIGHGWAVNILAEHVASGRERHAYLFTGPSGIGRRTLALRLAQSLNCRSTSTPGSSHPIIRKRKN